MLAESGISNVRCSNIEMLFALLFLSVYLKTVVLLVFAFQRKRLTVQPYSSSAPEPIFAPSYPAAPKTVGLGWRSRLFLLRHVCSENISKAVVDIERRIEADLCIHKATVQLCGDGISLFVNVG